MNDAWMRFSASYSGSFNPLHFDHVDAIREKGVLPVHRKTFEPIRSMLAGKAGG